MRNVRNQFHLVPDERIRSILLVGDWGAQAAQHHRAHFQGRLPKVGDLHVRLERTYPARLILSDDKFQMVASRSKHKASVVLHVLAANLLGALHRKFYRVAQLPHGKFSAFTHFTDDVDRRAVFLFFRNEGDL